MLAGIWRSPWDVELEDGAHLTVYHDLTRGGWYELDPAELAPIAAEIAIAAQKLRDYDASRPSDPA